MADENLKFFCFFFRNMLISCSVSKHSFVFSIIQAFIRQEIDSDKA